MPNSAGDRSQRKSDEILAGEYVLGVLPNAQHLLLDARMENDPQFAAVVHRWRRNLAKVEAEDRRRSQAVYDCIYGETSKWPDEKRGLMQRFKEPFAKLWRSQVFWRTATALLLLYLTVSMINEIG